ncbi:hypothetical protein ACLK1S_10940 [Escherichia coli]
MLKSGAQGDAFLARLVAVSQRLTPGNWDDEPQPFIGGLISEQAAQQVVTAWQQLGSDGRTTLLRCAYYNQRHRRDAGNYRK